MNTKELPVYGLEEVEQKTVDLANKEITASPVKPSRPHGPTTAMKNLLAGVKSQPKGMPRFLAFGSTRPNGGCFNCNQSTHYGSDYSLVNGEPRWVCDKFATALCKLVPQAP